MYYAGRVQNEADPYIGDEPPIMKLVNNADREILPELSIKLFYDYSINDEYSLFFRVVF